MFAKLVSATWGDATEAEIDSQDQGAGPKIDPANSERAEEFSQSKEQVGFSLWGVASSLADSVKKNTTEITTGLKETNWRAELEAFSKGVREEEHQLRKETAKRVEVAKERLPKDATAQLDVKRKELAIHLQKMGVGLGGIGKTLVTRTTDLFDQVRDTVVEELSASDKAKGRAKRQGSRPVIKGKYSRLEADISSMQRDSATYCDEPADTADYQAWRSNFNLDSYKPAVQELIADTAFMAELQARIVPVIVEYDAFWTRYFYRLHLLEARHAQRLEVAQRASRPQQEEELAWDDSDDQPQPEPQPQQALAPIPSLPSHSQISETSDTQLQASVSSPVADTAASIDDIDASVEAHAPAMQAVPEDCEVTVDTGGDVRHEHSMEKGEESQHEDSNQAASTAGEESAAETVTSSESGSGNEHWTVVKGPSKQGGTVAPKASAGNAVPKSNVGTAAASSQSTAPQSKKEMSPSAPVDTALVADDISEIDELDDVSNNGEADTSGGPGSERDEDWGSWE